MTTSTSELLKLVEKDLVKFGIPDFRVGDTVRVHARIVEGNKERIQVFEGTVIRRSKHDRPTATFTVRKVSFNIGVERTFMVHSPRIEQIQLVARGRVRRAGLYYLRELRGKAAKIKSQIVTTQSKPSGETAAVEAEGTQ